MAKTGKGSNPASWNLTDSNRNKAGQIKAGVSLGPAVRVRMPDEQSRALLLRHLGACKASQAEELGRILAAGLVALGIK